MSDQQAGEELSTGLKTTQENDSEGPATEEQSINAVTEKDSSDDRPAFLNEDESDEDDFVVTIGEIKTNVFQKQQRVGTGAATIDLDANPTLKDGSQIYDIDLATMEDKPWRKPGADITDYFNYGFNEETWNQYCERQRKFRAEFGTDQAAINKTILSNIQISGPVQVGLQTFAGGRQLVSLVGGQDSKQQQLQQNKVQKVVLDLSKPPPSITDQSQSVSLISRTVITGSGIITRQESTSELSSSLSHATIVENGASVSITSSAFVGGAGQSSISIGQSLLQPPPSETPPPGTTCASTVQAPPSIGQNISVIGSSAAPPSLAPLPMDFSKPPPTFDPAIPPPIVNAPPSTQPQAQQPQHQPPRSLQPQPSQAAQQQQQPAPPTTTQTVPSASATQMASQLTPRASAALVDLPPGVEDAEGPPGVEGPPGISDGLPPSRINFGQPPSTNQFSLGHSAMSSAGPPPPSASFGPPGVPLHHPHPPQMGGGIRPAPLFHSYRNPFGGPGGGGFSGRFHHPDRFRGGGRPFFKDRSPESDNDSPRRKKRRSRTKSRSPSPGRRHKEKDEKRKERSSHREKEGKKKKDKKERHSSSSAHHRSPNRKDVKSERRSSEREKDLSDKESRRRSPNRREKEMGRAMKTERRSPEKD